MPIYEFLCEDCGPFEERCSFDQAAKGAACPGCEGAARRVYSMPNLKATPAGLGRAMDRAEKSAHEPEVAPRPTGGVRYRPGHGGHHGHNH